jgi:hypothetical protein
MPAAVQAVSGQGNTDATSTSTCHDLPSTSPFKNAALNTCAIIIYTTVFYEIGAELPDPKTLLKFGDKNISTDI